jgi:hypothetical protein
MSDESVMQPTWRILFRDKELATLDRKGTKFVRMAKLKPKFVSNYRSTQSDVRIHVPDLRHYLRFV